MSTVKTNATSFSAPTQEEKSSVGPSITVKTETAGKIGLFGAISIISREDEVSAACFQCALLGCVRQRVSRGEIIDERRIGR